MSFEQYAFQFGAFEIILFAVIFVGALFYGAFSALRKARTGASGSATMFVSLILFAVGLAGAFSAVWLFLNVAH